MKQKIFFSFSIKDNKIVKTFYNELTEEYDIFKYGDSQNPEDIWMQIRNQISKSNIFIIFISINNILDSKAVKEELRVALYHKVNSDLKVIPVILGPPGSMIPDVIKDIPFVEHFNSSIKQTVENIEKFINNKPIPIFNENFMEGNINFESYSSNVTNTKTHLKIKMKANSPLLKPELQIFFKPSKIKVPSHLKSYNEFIIGLEKIPCSLQYDKNNDIYVLFLRKDMLDKNESWNMNLNLEGIIEEFEDGSVEAYGYRFFGASKTYFLGIEKKYKPHKERLKQVKDWL